MIGKAPGRDSKILKELFLPSPDQTKFPRANELGLTWARLIPTPRPFQFYFRTLSHVHFSEKRQKNEHAS